MNVLVFLLMMTLATNAREVSSEQYLEILAPGEHVSTSIDHLYIIGRTDAPIVEIYLDGKKIADRIVKKSIFHYKITYGWGLNEISITPVYSSQSSSVEMTVAIEILYGPRIKRQYRGLYPTYFFHNHENRDDCGPCHEYTYSDLSKADRDADCLECHRDFEDIFLDHTEVKNQTCNDCHRHGANLPNIGTGEDYAANPCFSCHKDKLGMFDKDFLHGPVAGGTCTICHNPHGSEYEMNLVQPVQLLCTECHDIDDELVLPYLHRPFALGYCSKCHDAHSGSDSWVLTKNSEELCLTCHEEEGSLAMHQHPYNVAPKRKLRTNLQLSTHGRLECVSCHHPHSGSSAHLLRTSQKFTCIGCHDDK